MLPINFISSLTVIKPVIISLFDNSHFDFLQIVLACVLVILIVMAVAAIASVIITGLLIGLISVGIISTSVISGLYQKSISKGFKTLFLSISIVGCTIVSVQFFWFINKINEWWSTNISILLGMACGVVAGLVIGLLIFKIIKKMIKIIRNKYKKDN